MASAEVAPPPAEKKGKKTGSTPKKAKPSAAKKPKTDPLHPSYLQMTSEAILALKERTGSSQFAITKYIESKYKSVLPANFKKILLVQLRNLVKQNKLVKVKGSYKLSPDVKKQVAPKTSRPKKVTAGEGEVKKVAPKKKTAPKKVVPKKPKSAKSPKKAAPAKKATPKATKSTTKPAAKTEPAKKVAPVKKPAAAKPKAPVKAAANLKVKKPAAKKPAKSPKAKKPAAKKAKKV